MEPVVNMNDLSSEVKPIAQLSAEEIAAWEALCLSQPFLASPFFSPHYMIAVSKVRKHVYVCVLMRGKQKIAFFPFQFASDMHKAMRAAERVGEEMTDHFGLIASAEVRLSPKELLTLSNLSSMEFTHLDAAQAQLGLVGENPEPGMLIRLDQGGPFYWQSLMATNAKLVKDTQRRRKKLIEECGEIHFQFANVNIEQEFDRLIQSKREQYTRTGVNDVFMERWKENLLRRLASIKQASCEAVISTLYVGNKWMASHFGLRHQHVLHYWFPVYNPEFKSYSPGRLLMAEIINVANAQGITLIDRGAGDSAFKRELANDQLEYFRGVWSKGDLRANLYRAFLSLKWRMREK